MSHLRHRCKINIKTVVRAEHIPHRNGLLVMDTLISCRLYKGDLGVFQGSTIQESVKKEAEIV